MQGTAEVVAVVPRSRAEASFASGRLAPLAGVVFVGLAVIAIVGLGGNTPGVGATPQRVTSFYSDHHGRQSTAAFVLALATPFLALFAATLWQRLAAGASSPLTRIGGALLIVGAAVAATGFLAAAFVHLALSEGVRHGIGASGAQALNTLDAEDFLAFSSGTGIMLLGAAALLAGRRGTKTLGWLAVVLAVLIFTPAGFAGFLGAQLWVVATSVLLAVRGPAAEAAPA